MPILKVIFINNSFGSWTKMKLEYLDFEERCEGGNLLFSSLKLLLVCSSTTRRRPNNQPSLNNLSGPLNPNIKAQSLCVFYVLFLFLGRDAIIIFVIFNATIIMMTTIGTPIIIAIANQTFNQVKEFNQICVLSMVVRQWGAFLLLVAVLACACKKGAINVIRNIVVTIKGNKEWWGGA